MTVHKWLLRLVGLSYLLVVLAAPVTLVFYRAFEHGIGPAWDAVTTPEAKHAFYLTVLIAAIAVPANTIWIPWSVSQLPNQPVRL